MLESLNDGWGLWYGRCGTLDLVSGSISHILDGLSRSGTRNYSIEIDIANRRLCPRCKLHRRRDGQSQENVDCCMISLSMDGCCICKATKML